ncbi:DEAD/DEAH box helicase [Streptacidiphilus sp. PB12-B1b]|uniref:DEAD/DEAH box helicase n=1 Tax=Streptacidiphilus sp. PB12-B1b TaxID=2705012 RepID=UPI0015FE5FA5|nr:DEAD/DEAH box helicase [Streptacidiphilus sp. PB12-B1b]QMU80037.1 DEAD/DEAH box helicase [Streptacidiphilus sp. PB12-B1b]
MYGCPAAPRPAAHTGRGIALTTFRDLGILSETAEALEAVGITSPFPIQEMTLPVALSGHDVIGQAKTGTGKTLGFGLPIIDRVRVAADVDAGRCTAAELTTTPQALVVVPTRELCTQVTNDLQTAGKVRNVRVLAIYGGRAYEPQVEALQKGVDVVVGTPGRLLDLARQHKLDLSAVRILVLDEADEMLDLGFLPDVEKIMTMLPTRRQAMLFSATMPGQVISLARRYMSQPTHIRATAPDDTGATVAAVKQFAFRAHSMDKVETVARILQAEGRGLAMIFCRTKRTAADVSDQLTQRGFAAGAVHGDLGQGAREQALRAFRNGKVDVLVCTDVAARGIDVEGVTHVINYQCPEDEKTYLHRIGRTGRAGASGTAVTLVDWDDVPRWGLINKALELGLAEPEETYSTSPHLFELLNIAPGTKGVLPRADRTRAGLGAEQIEDLGEPGGRGPRGRGESRTEGRGDGRRPAAAPAAPAEERPRRERQRRRTRGAGAEAAAPAVVEASSAEAATVETAVIENAVIETAVAEAPAAPRRRRRAAEPAEAVEPLVAAVEAALAPVALTEPEAEAPAPRRRRRAAKAVEAVDTVDAPLTAAPAAEAAAEAPVAERNAPRRRRRAAEAVVVVEATGVESVTVDSVVAVESAAVAEPSAESEAAAPRRRRRPVKAAAEAVESAAEAGAVEPAPVAPAEPEAEAAAPRRRRRAVKAAESPAAAPVEAVAAAAPVAPAEPEAEAAAPRRRRRAARPEGAAAEAVAAPAEVPAPRRRPAPAAKASVPAPAETEAAPRRLRRSERLAAAAAAQAAAESATRR